VQYTPLLRFLEAKVTGRSLLRREVTTLPVERVTGDKGMFNEPRAYGKLG
jgi:hypothetical protein